MNFRGSFKEILREKMSSQAAAPMENSTASVDSSPAHLAFLISQIGKFEFNNPRAHYPRPQPRAPRPRPAHTLSPQQEKAFQYLRSYVPDLHPGFSANELKKAFRQAALMLHPDHGGSGELFMELKANLKILQKLDP